MSLCCIRNQEQTPVHTMPQFPFLCSAKVNELEKIKVGAVSYLNTKPFLYGFEHSNVKEQMEVSVDYPARVAQGLNDGTLDVALLPVAVLAMLPEYHFVGDYGIACDGEVASVALFSDVPMEEIQTVLLDYQSRTSVALARLLFQHHWKQNPVFEDAGTDFRNQIKGTTAGVVIGDRALEQRLTSKYVYDLGTAWKEMTGLSFVFAAWVSRRRLPDEFIHAFNAACATGMQHLEEVVKEEAYGVYDLNVYYTKNIHFFLDEEKKKGMNHFLQLLKYS